MGGSIINTDLEPTTSESITNRDIKINVGSSDIAINNRNNNDNITGLVKAKNNNDNIGESSRAKNNNDNISELGETKYNNANMSRSGGVDKVYYFF